jgi:hypothetical protein
MCHLCRCTWLFSLLQQHEAARRITDIAALCSPLMHQSGPTQMEVFPETGYQISEAQSHLHELTLHMRQSGTRFTCYFAGEHV